MKLQITATNVDGKVNAPPSKSYTHRALVLSALAHGDSIVRKALLSADTLATLKGMESLGRSSILKATYVGSVAES